ncbi:PIN domain-containing protein [Winogradskyella sediminis]|uniref:PIN domain-containing protein n=1 Tax=Winogradskyella sediminis TaxID=1382466 RepID=A0A1H1X4T1_9FLAO|nr:PIN domain-containing protein [Winogradskyella sediminis]SDT04080.1 PIN domain-containing protein [Winogradskyella sediminis]
MNVNERIENICTKVPAFIPLYNVRVRHYVIKQHIQNVFNQFEKYFSQGFDKKEIEWFRLFLLLHDLGKSIAYKNGNINNQTIETVKLLEQYESELELSKKELSTFTALLRASSIGKYMESKISLNDSYDNIIKQSKIVGMMPLADFFYFLSVYYQCDIASYTGDAGGIPYLEHLFEYQKGEKIYCEKKKLLKLSEVYTHKYDTLSNKILEYNKSQINKNKVNLATQDISLKVLDKIDLSKFEKPKKEIKKNKENLYIIDTNVFVDYPDIISKINKKYPVILSAKVIDELDNLKSKLDNESKRNVQKALKSINGHLDTRDLRMEISDISLLPVDFNKHSPDNQILTVALKFKSENPILLTSDNGLQVKAKGLKLTTITLREFLNQLKRR